MAGKAPIRTRPGPVQRRRPDRCHRLPGTPGLDSVRPPAAPHREWTAATAGGPQRRGVSPAVIAALVAVVVLVGGVIGVILRGRCRTGSTRLWTVLPGARAKVAGGGSSHDTPVGVRQDVQPDRRPGRRRGGRQRTAVGSTAVINGLQGAWPGIWGPAGGGVGSPVARCRWPVCRPPPGIAASFRSVPPCRCCSRSDRPEVGAVRTEPGDVAGTAERPGSLEPTGPAGLGHAAPGGPHRRASDAAKPAGREVASARRPGARHRRHRARSRRCSPANRNWTVPRWTRHMTALLTVGQR